jgi:hypothetical protein
MQPERADRRVVAHDDAGHEGKEENELVMSERRVVAHDGGGLGALIGSTEKKIILRKATG